MAICQIPRGRELCFVKRWKFFRSWAISLALHRRIFPDQRQKQKQKQLHWVVKCQRWHWNKGCEGVGGDLWIPGPSSFPWSIQIFRGQCEVLCSRCPLMCQNIVWSRRLSCCFFQMQSDLLSLAKGLIYLFQRSDILVRGSEGFAAFSESGERLFQIFQKWKVVPSGAGLHYIIKPSICRAKHSRQRQVSGVGLSPLREWKL